MTHSLQHELADKGLRIQAVLPGATATDFWDKTGLPYENLPASIVMSAEDMVDAALVGLDQGELVTIPSLHNGDDWDRLEDCTQSRFHSSLAIPSRQLDTASLRRERFNLRSAATVQPAEEMAMRVVKSRRSPNKSRPL